MTGTLSWTRLDGTLSWTLTLLDKRTGTFGRTHTRMTDTCSGMLLGIVVDTLGWTKVADTHSWTLLWMPGTLSWTLVFNGRHDDLDASLLIVAVVVPLPMVISFWAFVGVFFLVPTICLIVASPTTLVTFPME